MKIYIRYSLYFAFFFALTGFCTPAGAMTTLSSHGVRHTAVHRVKKKTAEKPVKFITWKGNRLSTTVGTFVLDPSVQVIDKANTRKWKGNFRGPAPTVRLYFKDRRLVKVIIR